MKKYFLGMMAIAMAIGFSAFTTKNSKKRQVPDYLFSYVPPGGTDFSQESVANPDNWVLIDDDYTGIEQTCGEASTEAACELVVSSEHVVDFKITITIEVELGTLSRWAAAAINGIKRVFNAIPH